MFVTSFYVCILFSQLNLNDAPFPKIILKKINRVKTNAYGFYAYQIHIDSTLGRYN